MADDGLAKSDEPRAKDVFNFDPKTKSISPEHLKIHAMNFSALKSLAMLGEAMAASGNSCCAHQGTLDILDSIRDAAARYKQ